MFNSEPKTKKEEWKSPLMTTHRHIACTVCGCVCDDLELTIRDEQIVEAKRACHLAEPWYLSQESRHPAAAEIDGVPVSFDRAVDRAAEILREAKAPLIYGLSRSSTEGQKEAVALADRLRAFIDTTASTCHAPSIMAIQQVGESTSTLGEIRNRADLVIYWSCDPLQSHPRHLERYGYEPEGLLIRGPKSRHLVVIDHEPSVTAERADSVLKLKPHQHYEAIAFLRQAIRGIDGPVPAGLPKEQLQELADRMRNCRCGVIFFGLGLARLGTGHRQVEALLRLVSELNDFAPFYARRMRVPGDVTGADSVLCWQTGFPFAVSLTRGYPRYNPGEYSAVELLRNRQVDACLFVGSEGIAEFPRDAADWLTQIPTVHLDYPTQTPVSVANVRFATAVYGVHCPGTVYRMDEVPVPLRAVLPARYASDEQVLAAIRQKLESWD